MAKSTGEFLRSLSVAWLWTSVARHDINAGHNRRNCTTTEKADSDFSLSRSRDYSEADFTKRLNPWNAERAVLQGDGKAFEGSMPDRCKMLVDLVCVRRPKMLHCFSGCPRCTAALRGAVNSLSFGKGKESRGMIVRFGSVSF